ncbi:unnamed protein product, partial [Polarella glacialis]
QGLQRWPPDEPRDHDPWMKESGNEEICVKARQSAMPNEWPEIRVADIVCLEDRLEVLLRWGESAPERHLDVSRLELELALLTEEDFGGALLDPFRWTVAGTCNGDAAQGSKVLCAVGTTPLCKGAQASREVFGDTSGSVRCVQRLPAHLGCARQAAQVRLAGVRPGAALALRLRPWNRRENRWGPPGGVLLLMRQPREGSMAENIKVAASSLDLLNGIQAQAADPEET